ncbi:unnamed protein product [Sympodiomycopsis kandeliae]
MLLLYLCICVYSVLILAHPIAFTSGGSPTTDASANIQARGLTNALKKLGPCCGGSKGTISGSASPTSSPGRGRPLPQPTHQISSHITSPSSLPSHQVTYHATSTSPSPSRQTPPHGTSSSNNAPGRKLSSPQPGQKAAYDAGIKRIRKQQSGINHPAWSPQSFSPDHNLRWMQGLRAKPASKPFEFLSDSESSFSESASTSRTSSPKSPSNVSSPKENSLHGIPSPEHDRWKGKAAIVASPARTSSSSSSNASHSDLPGPSGTKSR